MTHAYNVEAPSGTVNVCMLTRNHIRTTIVITAVSKAQASMIALNISAH